MTMAQADLIAARINERVENEDLTIKDLEYLINVLEGWIEQLEND